MTSIKKIAVSTALLSLFGCGGGRWVDAPQACMGGWGILQLANLDEMAKQMMGKNAAKDEPETKDLKAAFERMIEQEKKKKGVSDKDVKEAQQALENAIGMGARSVCGNIGKSYTGDWECTETQQRVKCK